MKPRAKPIESKVDPKFDPLFDPILDELYRARDAYARKFNFDTDAICDALARRTKHTPASTKPSPASLKKTARHRAGPQRTTGRNAAAKLAA